MNTNALRSKNSWLLWATVVPVAGYFIYRSLTPSQKKRFHKSLRSGTLSMAGTLLTSMVNQYRNQPAASDPSGKNGVQSRLTSMARIPNADETETTIGDERW